MLESNMVRNWYKTVYLCAVGILSLFTLGMERAVSGAKMGETLQQGEDKVHLQQQVGSMSMEKQPVLEIRHMIVGLEGTKSVELYGESSSTMPGEEDEKWEEPILVNQYFLLYGKASCDNADVAYTVDIEEIRQQAGICDSWISFEGVEGKIPNIYALDTRNGYIREELVDKECQMYQGRFMVAVGPAVMNPKYCGTYINASDMYYGTFLDIVLVDTQGNEFYIPCVVADCKMHTYPNGYYQTGKALCRNGVFEDVPQCADYSFVEFTAGRLNADGTSRSAGLCSEYSLNRIIVYTLEASLRGK